MKKKSWIVGICILVISLFGGCTKEKEAVMAEKPEEAQIRAICELSTLECYYHNVAKAEKEKGEGLKHLGEKDRKFWIEYTGMVKIGIDISEVRMRIEEKDVIITMPKAKVLGIGMDENSYQEDSFLMSEDGFLNANKITAEDQTAAMKDAQEQMKKTVENNSALLLQAQERAKTLIQNYIEKLGDATGVTYYVKWEYS